MPYKEFFQTILQSFRLSVYQREKVQPSFSHPSAKLQEDGTRMPRILADERGFFF